MKRYAKEQQVLRKLEENGWEAWFVGGCVRDALRGEPCDDIDITTNATPQEVMAVFGAENIIETGLAHGTVTVKPQMAEVTTYRTEGAYTDHRHPDQVTFVRSLREDLKRRDFTINAMAMDCRGILPSDLDHRSPESFAKNTSAPLGSYRSPLRSCKAGCASAASRLLRSFHAVRSDQRSGS